MRIGRILLFIVVMTGLCLTLAAQNQVLDLPQFTPPSPNSASLGKYGDIQIGKYTGSTNVSIPIHTLTLGKFSLPIDLNYTTSGLKVEEAASLVGLGWSLNAGGVITRTVHALPDEGAFGYWLFGGLSDSAILAINYPEEEYSVLWTGGYDLEPDMFYFNFAGKSGKFILDTTSTHKAHCIPYQNMQIQHDSLLNNFTVTDDEGNIYYFGATETTYSEMNSSSSIYTSTWYLTEIKTPYGSVTINYNSTPEQSVSIQISEVDYTKVTGAEVSDKGSSTAYNTNSTVGKMISQISAGDEQINFYGTQDRKDMNQASMLDSITVADNFGNVKKRFALKHSYFGDTTYPTFQGMRLKLDTVIAESVANDQPQIWALTYYLPANVPPTSSFSQDFWGFYNGHANSTLLPAASPQTYNIPTALSGGNRNPNAAAAVTGCLQTIKYPTGGSSSFVYEGNDYGYVQSLANNSQAQLTNAANVGAVISSSLNVPSTSTVIHIIEAGNISMTISGGYGGGATPVDNGPSVYINELTPDGGTTNVFQALGVNITGSETQNLYIRDTGYYQLLATVDGTGENVSMTVIYDSLGTVIKTIPVGGVRIREIINTDSISGVQNIKTYRYTMPGDTTRSSGNIVSSYEFIDYLGTYLVRSSYSQLFLGATQGGDVGYQVVTEFDTQDGYTAPLGRTEYYYNIDPVNQFAELYNFIDLDPGQAYKIAGVLSPAGPSDKMATEYDSYRGFLTEQIDYNALGNIIHKTVDTYDFTGYINPTFDNPVYYSLPARRAYEYTQCPSNCTQCQPFAGCDNAYTELWTTEASVNCPWIYKTSTADTTYDVNGANPVGSVQNFYYDNPTHALVTRITSVDSKGDSLLTVNKYAPDQAQINGLSTSASNALTTMTTANKVAAPIEVDHYNNGSLLNILRTDYNVWNASPLVVEPQHVWYSIFSNPLEDRLDYYQYDTCSNVLEVSKTGDAHHAYIWDYQHQHLIAEVVNAQQSDIAYTSFEADGTGNWSTTGGSVDPTQSISGQNSYQNGTLTKTGLNPATTYIVSYWSQNGAYSISGTISGYPMQGKTIGFHTPGWTLYVHKVTGQSTITVSPSGHIDELRLYPSTAQMTTYTFDPVYGETTKMDVGNRATYYEYDGLARLKRIRDQDYNILKTYEYQYQVPAGCNGCQSLAMETFLGTNTIGYPVGVFDIHGNLVGNAAGASAYVSLWNSDTADARVGTLSAGNDSLHFNIILHTGQTLPASVTGCRYFQVDLAYTNIDGVRNFNGTYVDFGDGTGMHLGTGLLDTPAVIPPYTTHGIQAVDVGYTTYPGVVYDHTYPSSSQKTLTFYHNDAAERSDFDNIISPAPSLTQLKNLRGNLPVNTPNIGGSCYQQSTMSSVANIANWSSIRSIQNFRLNNGDNTNPCENIGYAQDFLAGDPGLISIMTAWAIHRPGNGDSTFKLSRLKSNWNTYFTQLQYIGISEDDWNHEDLSGLTNLRLFQLIASGQVQDNASSTLVPLDPTEIDNIINQIAAGAGQSVRNGTINIVTGGTSPTPNSATAITALTGKGWTIVINTTAR